MAESRCERCDLPVGQCEHTRPRVDHDVVLISPRKKAHLPGRCVHYNDTGMGDWGEIRGVVRAWERIGNGETLTATGGGNPALSTGSRCIDCVGSVP
ncbi:hypothetical protein [Saccharopolyspora sp. CA-218241]|uniref:hypothetical protein n=1 Tax=Saccharopolyspora sp. CA-218241 TaxID=3240027 RepID=UPI003D957172